MRVAAHTPDFFPALTVVQKMMHADCFILADDIEFSTKSTVNRARIKTHNSLEWLSVPVLTKGKGAQQIRDVEINNAVNWRQKHWRTLTVNYQLAAYFEKFDLYLEAIYKKEWRFLLDLNLELLSFLRRELQCGAEFVLSSELEIDEKGVRGIVRRAQKCRASIYLAEDKLAGYLQPDVFKKNGIKLQFFSPPNQVYHQLFGPFIPELSSVDLLLNEGNEAHSYL